MDLNLRAAHCHRINLIIFHHLDKLIVSQFLLRAAGEGIFHEINSGKRDQGRDQKNGDRLVALGRFAIVVLLVIIHMCLFSILDRILSYPTLL